jgi:bacterial/archaeal transporter family protein
MKTALLIALMVLSDSSGDVFLTRGMKQVGEVSVFRLKSLLAVGRRVLTNPSFLSGIFFVAVAYFSFLIVLSWADLSLVFPAKSMVYLTSTLGAKCFLREKISFQRWGGIFLVCLGVALISLP